MNCAIYARVSSDEQAKGNSLDTQLDKGRAHAAAQGWPVVAEYVDPGFSGTTDQRPAFQQMISAALAGKFQVVIVYSFDRFARNIEDAVVYKSMLRREDVQIVSIIEPMDNSPLSFIFEGIVDLFAAFYSINLSDKVKAGQRKVVEQGGWPYKVPTGYTKIKGVVSVDQIMGPKISRAFREFATGRYVLDSWVERAWEMGITNANGGKLWKSEWWRIFRNPFYTGQVHFDGMVAPGQHQALVSAEVFAQVQSILDSRNNNTTGAIHRAYLLRGRLWSLDAKSQMTGAVGKGRLYYRSVKPTAIGKKHYVPCHILEADAGRILESVVLKDGSHLDLQDHPLGLALRVAPNIGTVYAIGDNTLKAQILALVVKPRGLLVSGNRILAVNTVSPFRVQFDSILMRLGGLGSSDFLHYILIISTRKIRKLCTDEVIL